MLDSQTYRTREQLAKSVLPHWRFGATHNLDLFERVGFPVRADSILDLGQVFDSMQENRFDAYMRELDGLTVEEYEMLRKGCADALRFQASVFPSRQPQVPASTIMSVIALYKKFMGFNPKFKTLLEIGPGCGYLSFLLKNHAPLENYSQIEACESFYILQNLINLHCFGTRFDDRVFFDPCVAVADFLMAEVTSRAEIAIPISLKRAPALATHYPWWKIGELISQERQFEIVTSNANLLEFSPAALSDYLSLIGDVLEPDGVFIVQCFGTHAHGHADTLLEILKRKRFVPLLYANEEKAFRSPKEVSTPTLGDRFVGNATSDLVFPVYNALLIRKGHPLYDKYNNNDSFKVDFIAPEVVVDSIYFRRAPNRRKYSIAELVADLEQTLSM